MGTKILFDEFQEGGFRQTWHFCRWLPAMETLEKSLELYQATTEFEASITGRYYISRSSTPGFYVENPKDAVRYKLTFGGFADA